MKKILLALTISIFTVGAQAATCDVMTSTNNRRTLSRVQVKNVYFGRPTIVNISKKIKIIFTLDSVSVNPDNTIEYIEIADSDTQACQGKALFNAKNIYAGIETSCFGAAAPVGFDLVTVACRYQ